MDKNRAKLLFLFAAVSVLLTGCWDAKEINDLDLVTMVILNKQGENISFTIEVPSIMPVSSEGGNSGSKNTYVEGSGADFPEARNNLDKKLQKPLYLGTTRTLVITDKAAENDLAEYMFRLREDGTYRQKVTLVTTREEPAAFTDFTGETSSPGGFAIDDMLVELAQSGRTYSETSSNYVEDILSGRSFVVHCIDIVNRQHTLTGYSVFKNAKFIGFIPVEEARGLVFLLAYNPVFLYRVPFGSHFATVEVQGAGRKIKAGYKDGAIAFSVQMKYDAEVQYFSQVQLFPLDEQALEEISQNLERMLQEDVQKTIAQSQTVFQCDYLQLCDAFRTAYPDPYDKISWTEEYPKAQINVTTQIDISISQKMDYEPH